MTISYTSGLNFTAPSKGDTDWDVTEAAKDAKISLHDHTGGGLGTQIGASALAANAVGSAALRLANNDSLRARNAAGSADINVVKVNTSDLVVFPSNFGLGQTAQALTAAGAFTVSSSYITCSNAGATAATVNVPTAAQSGMIVILNNIGAGTWTFTFTGRAAASDVATVPTNCSLILFPLGTTCWVPFGSGGVTIA